MKVQSAKHLLRGAVPTALSLCWARAAVAAQADGTVPTTAAPVVPGVGDPFSAASLLQFAFGLLVVLGMVFLLAWVLRRMNRIQGGVQGRLRILAGLPLGSRERVVLVQVGDEQVLLGVAPGRVSRLHVLAQPLEVKLAEGGTQTTATGFAARLAAAMQKRRAG